MTSDRHMEPDRQQRRRRHGNTLGMYMYNVIPRAGPPETQLEAQLEAVDVLMRLSRDPNRGYCKVQTGIFIRECFRQEEFYANWGKSSLNQNLPHVLTAIVEGLDFCLEWPDVAKRAQLANKHPCIYNGCVVIMDITEGDYFSVGEKVAADGGFKGNGPLCDSSDNPGADPAGLPTG
ncbi:hypothetical protein B484DRAFT_401099 [Ochromonadaceae sp. CCMP2298]|nr:hypothetical protein B484DRAFT_401099 [Ochromonadaceae sp. CCMP2298]